MRDRDNPFIAREGIPYLGAAVVAIFLVVQFGEALFGLIPVVVLVWLFLVFRDPVRALSAVPLGVLSPVDGTVVETGFTDKGALNVESHRILIEVNSLGTYTARSATEGKIMDFRAVFPQSAVNGNVNGLWVRTDEGEDVVLQFRGHRFGLAPLAFLGYGERVGQGQRCAYLRLTRFAEVQLPINSHVCVEAGQTVAAGVDLLAKLPHP